MRMSHIYRQNPRTRQDNGRQDNAKLAKTIKHFVLPKYTRQDNWKDCL